MLGCSAFAQGVTDAPAERQFVSLPVCQSNQAVGSGPEAGNVGAGCSLDNRAFSLPFSTFWNALKPIVETRLVSESSVAFQEPEVRPADCLSLSWQKQN